MKTILLLSILTLTGCTLGPDWSPDVTAHAASWGSGPVYAPSGALLAPGNHSPQNRRTMLHE